MKIKSIIVRSSIILLFTTWSNFALCEAGNIPLPPLQETPQERLQEKQIMGWVEYIEISGANMRLKAKLDTGAKTSSSHAENIERFIREDKQWVRFDLKLKGRKAYIDKAGNAHDAVPEQAVRMEKPLSRLVKIKRHKQPSIERPVIKMPVLIAGRKHLVSFTLTDRSKFIYPVLLGRRFLKQVALVDPGKTFLTSNSSSPLPKKTGTIAPNEDATKMSHNKNQMQ
ncbi:MAG: RimK/LysX family protein [Pseudomonadales bacterium]|nr:RimK/LysX family protein [Pseudomonadales bacterium]